jgi:Domain of unknown function (DUF4258)
VTETLRRIIALVKAGKVLVTAHGFRRMASRGISADHLAATIDSAELLEDYPDAFAGPSCLVLQSTAAGDPVHVVWGIAKDTDEPAALITAYVPDPAQWSADFRSRKP